MADLLPPNRTDPRYLHPAVLPAGVQVPPDEAKGEQAYGHSVSAAVADDAQAAGELPGIESKKAYRTPTFVLLVLVSVLLQIVAALVQHVSSHEIAHGLTLEQGALVVSGIMFGAAIGKATIGILLDYLKPELTIVIYSAIGLAGWGLMAVATTPTPAIAAGFMAGLGQGVVLVALPWVIRKSFGQRDYSEILSIVSMFGAVASAIAVTAHGAVFDATGSYVPSLVAIWPCTWSPRPACHRIPYAPVQGNHEAGQVRPGKTDSRQTYI